jgi:hypothetical protein
VYSLVIIINYFGQTKSDLICGNVAMKLVAPPHKKNLKLLRHIHQFSNKLAQQNYFQAILKAFLQWDQNLV